MTTTVVYDTHLLVHATAFAGSTWGEWPSIPPITSNPEADCLGVVASSPQFGHDVALLLTDPLLAQVATGLLAGVGLRPDDVRDYLRALIRLARHSGGGRVATASELHTGHPDHVEVPLATAAAYDAVVVAAAPELHELGPEWGADDVPVLSASVFRTRVDAARRARRRE